MEDYQKRNISILSLLSQANLLQFQPISFSSYFNVNLCHLRSVYYKWINIHCRPTSWTIVELLKCWIVLLRVNCTCQLFFRKFEKIGDLIIGAFVTSLDRFCFVRESYHPQSNLSWRSWISLSCGILLKASSRAKKNNCRSPCPRRHMLSSCD
ncbi:hypothetical protein HZH66_014676 [Vespula vulgaris]|uniref:Uncharacterized protein n=1 Tax=Vespula vulgaris TaxID=7454 RepID=A0A834J389_VESVU|nr:hypothetical protein HZH66_014676 [Vespula vulgaris]